MKLMHILQILPMLEVGGVETGTIDLARELVKRGHKVTVVSGGGKMVKELADIDVRHIKLPVYKKSFFTALKMVGRLERIIKDGRVDIVHARSRVPAIIAFFATRRTDASFITTAHGYYSTHALSRVMAWGRFVIVSSSVIGRHMIEDFAVPRDRIRFIPRGVDLERFKFNPIDETRQKTEYRIGVVGRITPIKGHAFFLQAIARVVRIFPKVNPVRKDGDPKSRGLSNGVKVLIVGDAPKSKPEYKENLKTLIRKLNIEEFVEFLGSRHDIPEVMSSLDLLVLPSVGQEAFGRVIIEAGAAGVPVISGRIGGAVDIIENNKTGMLVKPGDIMEMVDSIIKLLKDRPLAKTLAAAARKKVEREYSLTRMAENTIKVYEEACKKKRILVIKIGAIGDVILAVPSIREIRNNFPDAFISVLTGVESRHVLKKCPYIDELIFYDRNGNDTGLRGLLKVSGVVKRKAFDMSLDFQNSRASHIIAWLGAVRKRYGYSNNKFGFLLNNRLKPLKIGAGPVEEQFRVLKKAGINTIGASKRMELWPGKEDFSYVDDFLKNQWMRENQLLVGINVGGSWNTKRWPLENFARLSDMLAAKDIRVVVTGSKEESDIVKKFTGSTRAKIVNAAGKTTVTQLAALIKKCRVFVTSDSAPMHIASAMNTDFIALFGPTDARRHFEPTEKGLVLQKKVDCGPCYRARCKNIVCMKKITVDEVFKLVMERLKL